MRLETPSTTLRALRHRVGQSCKMVAALLIAGVVRSRDFAETEDWLATREPRRRAMIISFTLATLVAGAFLSAQAGVIGFLAYLLAVILIAR